MAKRNKKSRPLPVAALILAWLIPGAGHVYIGRPTRGIILCLTIAALFWSGIAIGGVMTVDRVNERWWFVADMFTGVHGLSAWRLSERVYARMDADLAGNSGYQEQLERLPRTREGRVSRQGLLELRQPYYAGMLAEENLMLVPPAETVARAYAGVAGLLNLLCIFDAVVLAMMGSPPEPATKKSPQAAAATESA